MTNTIKLAIRNGQLEAKPLAYLGGNLFGAYREAVGKAGLRWNGKVNAGAPSALAAAVTALSAAGFATELEGEETLSAASAALSKATETASAARSDEDAARARIDRLQAELAKRGKALYPYQIEGTLWLSGRGGGILGDEMGTGKTIQFLAAISENARAVVVCPATLRLNWLAEAKAWRPDLKATVLTGRSCFRWPEAGELVILAYEGLADETSPAPEGVVLAADEAQFAQNRKTLRTKRLAALAKTIRAAKGRTFALSGTPLKNRPPELYNILEVFGVAERAFTHFGRFWYLMGGFRTAYGSDWGTPRPEAAEALKTVMLRRERKDVLPDLPAKRWQTLLVEPTKETARLEAAIIAKLDEAGFKWDDQDEENDLRELEPGRLPTD